MKRTRRCPKGKHTAKRKGRRVCVKTKARKTRKAHRRHKGKQRAKGKK